MKASHRILALFFVLAGAGWLAADTIHLRNGRRAEGTFVGGDTRQVRLLGADGNLQTFDITEVQSIHFASPGSATPAAAPAPAARSLAPAAAAPAAHAREVVPDRKSVV